MKKVNLRVLFLTFLVFLITSCSGSVPGNNPVLNQGKINIQKEDFSDLEKEYLPFTTKKLTSDYLKRKLQKWLGEENGKNLVKELLFNIQKEPDLLDDLFTDDHQLWDDITAIQAVRDRMAIDATFKGYLDKFIPGEPPDVQHDQIPPGLTYRIANTGEGYIHLQYADSGPPLLACGSGSTNCEINYNETGFGYTPVYFFIHAFKMKAIKIYLDNQLFETINTPGTEIQANWYNMPTPVPGMGNHLVKFVGIPWEKPANYLEFQVSNQLDGLIKVSDNNNTFANCGAREGIEYRECNKKLEINNGSQMTVTITAFRMARVDIFVDGSEVSSVNTNGAGEALYEVNASIPGNGQHFIEFKGVRASYDISPGDVLEFSAGNTGNGYIFINRGDNDEYVRCGGGYDQCSNTINYYLGPDVFLDFRAYQMTAVKIYIDDVLFDTIQTPGTETQQGWFYSHQGFPAYGQHTIHLEGVPWFPPTNYLKFKVSNQSDGLIKVSDNTNTYLNCGAREGEGYNLCYQEMELDNGNQMAVTVSAFRMAHVEVWVDNVQVDTLETNGAGEAVYDVPANIPGNGRHFIEFKGVRASYEDSPGDVLQFSITNTGDGYIIINRGDNGYFARCGSGYNECTYTLNQSMGPGPILDFRAYKMTAVEIYIDGDLLETVNTPGTDLQQGSFYLTKGFPAYGQRTIEFRGVPSTGQ
jgi:hypothetical protein